MSELYTSLVRAKQELNGGTLPAMTPVPERVHHIIDPDLTVGMGALTEDPDKGLQCPVRGCGRWLVNLRQHLNGSHADVGGAKGVLRALSIPENVPLKPRAAREKQAEVMRRNIDTGKIDPMEGVRLSAEKRSAYYKRGRRTKRATTGTRNLTNTCEAQIAQRILLVAEKVGRSPSMKEAVALDPPLRSAAIRVYGSWNAAKAAVGLKTYDGSGGKASAGWGYGRSDVLEMLGEFYRAHGRLPTVSEGRSPTRTPVIPSRPTIIKHLKADSWRDAMDKVETALIARGIMPNPRTLDHAA